MDNNLPSFLEHRWDQKCAVQDASSAVRPGCVAAFSSQDGELDVVFEIRTSRASFAEDICREVKAAVVSKIGLLPSRVVAVEERTIAKTTSGKIRRIENCRRLSNNEHRIVYELKSLSTRPAKESGVLMSPAQETTEPLSEYHSVIASFFGKDFNENLSWDELGMTSLVFLEFRNKLSETLRITLPPSFQDDFPTPKELQAYIESHKGQSIPVDIPPLAVSRSYSVGWFTAGASQGIAVAVLILLLALTFVPAYHVGQLLASVSVLNEAHGRLKWQWVPFVIPVWMVSLSTLVVCCKWIVVGKYTMQEVAVPSTFYLRWWFVDRLVHVWEIWVGFFITDTPLIWLFYTLLGAKLHPTAQINAFIRDFDLVKIGANSNLSCTLSCHKFSAWGAKDELKIRFRPVRIGEMCTVRGQLGPGVSLGGGSRVEKLTSVPEGAQVPGGTVVEGSPAFSTGTTMSPPSAPSCCWHVSLGALKMLWLLIELYSFFCWLLLGQWLLNGRLPKKWRYTPLLYWCLLVLISSVTSMAVCVPLKWLLIGRRKAGKVENSLVREISDWAVDYHFSQSIRLLNTCAENSKLVNLYLMALGMNIDLKSHIWAAYCPPSKVDLLTVRNTFMASIFFDTVQNGSYRDIKVFDSSTGGSVVLNGGVTVRSSKVSPFSHVKNDMIQNCDKPESWVSRLHPHVEVLSLVVIFVICISCVPAYELFKIDVSDPAGFGFSVAKFGVVLGLQTCIWLLMFLLFQKVAMQRGKGGDWQVLSLPLYGVYLTVDFFIIWRWSLIHLTYGTPYINMYLKSLGSTIEGQLLFFGRSIYDYPLLTFSDRTVIDQDAVVCAHSITSDDGLLIAPTRVSGILHQGSTVLADTDMAGAKETGPCKFVVPKRISRKENSNITALERQCPDLPSEAPTNVLVATTLDGYVDGDAVCCLEDGFGEV